MQRIRAFKLTRQSRLKFSKTANRAKEHMKVVERFICVFINCFKIVNVLLCKHSYSVLSLVESVRSLTGSTVEGENPVSLNKAAKSSEIRSVPVNLVIIHIYKTVNKLIGISVRSSCVLVIEHVVK